MRHNTLARNLGGDGDGVRLVAWDSRYSQVTLTNTLIASHTVGLYVETGSHLAWENVLWGGGNWANGADSAGGGTVQAGSVTHSGAPAFVDPENGDYHIRFYSAARDRAMDLGLPYDVDGQPRSELPDIGADEYVGETYDVYLPLVARHYP